MKNHQKLSNAKVKEYVRQLYRHSCRTLGAWSPAETLVRGKALRSALRHSLPDLPEQVKDRPFWPEAGICDNIRGTYDLSNVIDLVGLTALQFDWCCMDLPRANFGLPVEIYTYPVEGVDAYCRTVNLWEGEGLTKRLQLLDAVIEVLEYVCDMEDEL